MKTSGISTLIIVIFALGIGVSPLTYGDDHRIKTDDDGSKYVKVDGKRIALALPESEASEHISSTDALHIWMAMLLRRCREDYSKVKVQIDSIIRNNASVERDGRWFINLSSDTERFVVVLKSTTGPIVTARKTIYADATCRNMFHSLSYQIHFKEDNTSLFSILSGEGILFRPNGNIEGYYFKLTPGRCYEAQFDVKGKLFREYIRKRAKDEVAQKPLNYKPYFPGKDDLSILKNKLLHRDLCAWSVARAEVEKTGINLEKKIVRSTGYDMDYDNEGKIARFLRKTTGDEVAFHPNGKVKAFRIQLTDSKDFKAEWDSMGKLVKEQEIPR